MRKLIRSVVLLVLLCAPVFPPQGARPILAGSSPRQPVNTCSGNSRLLGIVVSPGEGQRLQVPIRHLPDQGAVYFVSGMTIDADGAPNAYHPDDTGLDELANAGVPGRWDGIISDREGNPFIQEESDPFPGYYISCTSLADESKKFTDPARYVDASKIPYIALPAEIAERSGLDLGDFAFVMNLRNGKSSFAIYADIGTLGEGSIALAESLGLWSNARAGGTADGILYVLFPGSGNFQPRDLDEINEEGEKLLSHAGGLKLLSECAQTDNSSTAAE